MKKKFDPVVSRIRLNPEQAVLSCSCYDSNLLGAPYPEAWGGIPGCMGWKDSGMIHPGSSASTGSS